MVNLSFVRHYYNNLKIRAVNNHKGKSEIKRFDKIGKYLSKSLLFLMLFKFKKEGFKKVTINARK